MRKLNSDLHLYNNNNVKFLFTSRALLLLRKKKFQEQILSKTDSQLDNLERLVHDLEFAQVEIKVIDGLKVGNTALKKLNDVLSIEDIEKVMDETREGVDKQNEINEILMGSLTDEDEADAEAELDALLAEDAKETIPEIPEISEDVQLPDVPEDSLTKEKGILNLFNNSKISN